jgi:hypothetical protein
MGKRSEFRRIARDAYDTPNEAVAPLLPWLTPRTKFLEPCTGAGKLIEHLTRAGHILARAYDLPRLRMIVSIGRVRWIPDSEYTGKDNACWYLFERPSAWAQIRFIGRQPRESDTHSFLEAAE